MGSTKIGKEVAVDFWPKFAGFIFGVGYCVGDGISRLLFGIATSRSLLGKIEK